MTTKTEAAHEVRKALQSVRDYWSLSSRPKLSEADTRAHFIDPLLRALGYRAIGDIQHEVYVETAKQYLDYLLVVNALPRVAIEAKACEVALQDSHGAQVVQYCSVLGIEWAVVTNARQWRLYHGFAPGPLHEKQLSSIDLLHWETDGEYNAVFEQLWLVSKEAFESGGGPADWLAAQQVDSVLQKALSDPLSPEVKYLRKRLADQGIAASTDQIAGWFKTRSGATTSSVSIAPAHPPEKAKSPALSPASAVAQSGISDALGSQTDRHFFRLMLGRGSKYADVCFAGNFIGTDFGIHQDLSKELPEDWHAFNRKFVPVLTATHPEVTPIGAGLACGALWTVSKGIRPDDIVLCPDGSGHYAVGQVIGEYKYEPSEVLPHRRMVKWIPGRIARSAMSKELRNSAGSIGTVCNVSGYRSEIDQLIATSSLSSP